MWNIILDFDGRFWCTDDDGGCLIFRFASFEAPPRWIPRLYIIILKMVIFRRLHF